MSVYTPCELSSYCTSTNTHWSRPAIHIALSTNDIAGYVCFSDNVPCLNINCYVCPLHKHKLYTYTCTPFLNSMYSDTSIMTCMLNVCSCTHDQLCTYPSFLFYVHISYFTLLIITLCGFIDFIDFHHMYNKYTGKTVSIFYFICNS